MNRILVVEDSATQAEELRLILESEGFEVEVATDGLNGWAFWDRVHFDLVISDIIMPGLSGYDLCRKIKSSTKGRITPVILFTSLKDPLDIVRGLESGADGFVTKPCDPERLIARVKHIRDNRELRAHGGFKSGIEINFLGKRFEISSEKEQILDLLIGTFEDSVRTNRELLSSQAQLAVANARLEEYARQLEGQVRLSEIKYRDVVESANDGILVVGLDGLIVESNRAIERLSGLTREEVVGKPIEILLSAESGGWFREQVDRFRAIGNESLSGTTAEVQAIKKGGGRVPVELAVSYHEAEDQVLLIAILRDISERKRAEQNARMLEISKTQKIEAVAILAAGVAHHFNNLLQTIMGHTALLQSRIPAEIPVHSSAMSIQKASQRAADLVRRLMAFGKDRSSSLAEIGFGSVLDSVLQMGRPSIPENIEVRVNTHLSPARLVCDPVELEQVLLNLILNAVDAMPVGGTITISTSGIDQLPDSIQISDSMTPGSYLVCTIEDTGCGMGESVLAHMFEPFFTTKGPDKGVGLGLSTAYALVQKMGGTITVRSSPGMGSVFSLYLPLAKDQVCEEELPVVEPPVQKPPTRATVILVVDDEECVLMLISTILRSEGHTVITATSGEEALRICKGFEAKIEMLLTDLIMPHMNGRHLANRLLEMSPKMKILYMSGHSRETIALQRLPEGESYVLPKPFDNLTLIDRVRSTLASD